MPAPSSVFFAFRDSPQRRAALRSARGSAGRYALFGLDEIAARGVDVRHNLERDRRTPLWARAAAAVANRPLYAAGGYGGDFASVLASLRQVNAADVIFSTVDTVGIPLILLKRAGLVRRPLVYVSIGLPERLEQLRGERMRNLYQQPSGRRPPSSRTARTRRAGCGIGWRPEARWSSSFPSVSTWTSSGPSRPSRMPTSSP